MKNLKWVPGGKMSLHTQRILSKWVQSENCIRIMELYPR